MEPENREPSDDTARPDPAPELARLVELATKYPEIGPPLAELAFKIGQPDVANQVVRMGLERGTPGLEYYFVAASAARRDGRYADALRLSLEAVRAYAAAAPETLAPDDGTRLLHLVRLGFATLMFDVKDVNAAPPELVAGLAEELPRLEARLGGEPFFRTLLAQTVWYADRERSEQEWERAVELGEPELTWNARGTWYKEAERDLDKAERAYRSGLEKAPHSALLLHNLAQILVERAGRQDVGLDAARRLLKEADDLLRAALREEGPRGLRRHIHSTRDRLGELRSSLPPRSRPARGERTAAAEPEHEAREVAVGDVVRGRVVSLAAYGVFVSLGGRQVGLLHKSELAHEPVGDPAALVKVGDELDVKVLEIGRRDDGKLRIGLSRKALLAPPAGGGAEPAERPRERRDAPARGERGERGGGERGGGRRGRREAEAQQQLPPFPTGGKLASLGELILAKLKDQGSKS